MDVNEALEKLSMLLNGWGLTKGDYVLVDEFAYLLQGYNLKGPELASKHLDLYVNPKALPWIPKDERSTIPPVNTPYMRNYEYFMSDTGYSLDLLVANPAILNAKRLSYKLENGKIFPLMDVEEMTEQFVNHTLLHYSLEDVGETKIVEWFDKLTKLNELAKGKGNSNLSEMTNGLILKTQKYWSGVVNLS